jgi:hypothetical protein
MGALSGHHNGTKPQLCTFAYFVSNGSKVTATRIKVAEPER